MTILYAVIAAIAGAAAGWFGSALLFMAIMLAVGESDREGALAMGAFFSVGPIGAAAGALIGAGLVIYIRRGREGPRLNRTVLIVLAVVAAALYGGYSWLNSGMDKPQFPERGPKPILNFEIDVADSGWPTPADYDGRIELHTFDRLIYPDKIAQKHENETHRVAGRIPLLHKYDRRQFAYWISTSEVHYFELKLGKVPQAEDDYGHWFVADNIGSRITGASKRADADSPVRMRIKITWE